MPKCKRLYPSLHPASHLAAAVGAEAVSPKQYRNMPVTPLPSVIINLKHHIDPRKECPHSRLRLSLRLCLLVIGLRFESQSIHLSMLNLDIDFLARGGMLPGGNASVRVGEAEAESDGGARRGGGVGEESAGDAGAGSAEGGVEEMGSYLRHCISSPCLD